MSNYNIHTPIEDWVIVYARRLHVKDNENYANRDLSLPDSFRLFLAQRVHREEIPKQGAEELVEKFQAYLGKDQNLDHLSFIKKYSEWEFPE